MEKTKTKKKHYRLWEYVLYGLSYLALITPMAILVLKHKDIYFKPKTAYSTTLVLIAVVVLFLLKNRTKNFGNTFWVIVFTIISYLIKPILNDLTLILTMASIGAISYALINKGKEWFKLRADAYMNGTLSALTQKNNVEAITEAINNINNVGENGRV